MSFLCFPYGKKKKVIEDGIDIVIDLEAASSDSHVSGIKTLGDSLRYFKLKHHLDTLELSLEDLRRNRNNQEKMEVHNSLIQKLDKRLLKLSMEHHPDKVQSRKGSEEELLLAQKLQTALNATRKALNILNKIFLEDLDIDHKYGFYTKLDISSLGNEDEIEGHVFDVLFKISLMSEIKQCHIIAEIGKFLTESQSCIVSYVQDNVQDFDKHLSSSFFHLKQCIRGYHKLLRELKEVEEECKAEKLDNIWSLIKRMTYNCTRQLNHLEQLLPVIDLCSKGSFGIFSCAEELDVYFVSPFVSYINILLMCDVFKKRDNKNKSKKFKLMSYPEFNYQTMFLNQLYYLTSYYGGSKRYENEVQKLLEAELIDQISIKEKFLDILLKTQDELKTKFKVDEYSTSGSKRHIAEELKKCKEMKFEFDQKKKDLAEDIALVKNDTQVMNEQIDKIIKDQEERRKQCEAHLAESSDVQEKFEHFVANMNGINQQFEEMRDYKEQHLKEYEACAAKYSELQARFAPTSDNSGNQQMDKVMSEEHRNEQFEACMAESSDIQEKFEHFVANMEGINPQSEEMRDDKKQHLKEYEACAAKYSELQARFASTSVNTGNPQMNKVISEEHRNKQFEACMTKNSKLQAQFSHIMKNTEEMIQQYERQHPKLYQACVVKNPELQYQ